MVLRQHSFRACSCHNQLCQVPPSPDLLARMHKEYTAKRAAHQIDDDFSFDDYYREQIPKHTGPTYAGLNNGVTGIVKPEYDINILRPKKKLKGTIRTLVLLVDFEDRPHAPEHTVEMYKEMLFGVDGHFTTGSMREYYRDVSGWTKDGSRGIDIEGEVHGWLRLPQTLSYYANCKGGLGIDFPKNSQGMARDAIEIAKNSGVSFDGYDALGEKIVTALFIIHAGKGQEDTNDPNDIWSHKWIIPDNGVFIDKNLSVVTYLTVPEDCKVGVCAHEWGHLAARWADYYDTDKINTSAGLGNYCLMATGVWGNAGVTPTYPNGMLRMFHGWLDVETIRKSKDGIRLKPAAEGGSAIVILNEKKMVENQYIFVEYRRKKAQDTYLPDQGLTVYVVDESIDNVNDEKSLAIELIQADNLRHLAEIGEHRNFGDSGDLYPQPDNNTIGQTTEPPLNLPNGQWTGVTLKISGTAGDDELTLDVVME